MCSEKKIWRKRSDVTQSTPSAVADAVGIALVRLKGGKQGPDLRYLRRAIWKGRDFFDSRILIQILDVVMNNFGTLWEQPNFGTSWEQPNFGTSWEQPSFGCSHEVGFLAFWPWKWPWRSILTTDLNYMAFVTYVSMVLFAQMPQIDCL